MRCDFRRPGSTVTATLRPGWFLTGRAWLDVDNRHVWFAHDCTTERVTTMLPWPNWHSDGLHVQPSLFCEACGFHTNLDLEPPDQDHRCKATFEHDGRWCERIIEHTGTHRAGSVEWGEYTRGNEGSDQ